MQQKLCLWKSNIIQHTKTNSNLLTGSVCSGTGCLFLNEENLCWLRTENLRKDSRLREAKCRKDDVRLKGFLLPASMLVLSCVTAVETKLKASCKDLLIVPIHWFICVCATVNLSPRYSILQYCKSKNYYKANEVLTRKNMRSVRFVIQVKRGTKSLNSFKKRKTLSLNALVWIRLKPVSSLLLAIVGTHILPSNLSKFPSSIHSAYTDTESCSCSFSWLCMMLLCPKLCWKHLFKQLLCWIL